MANSLAYDSQSITLLAAETPRVLFLGGTGIFSHKEQESQEEGDASLPGGGRGRHGVPPLPDAVVGRGTPPA